MQVKWVQIENFRAIEKLDWKPQSELVCIIGAGDTGKSSLLDAIEVVLSPKKNQFFDTDFINGDVSKKICITITIGELSSALFDENKFGLFLRGWGSNQIHDEPLEEDEIVVTVRLTVEGNLLPVWELITDRSVPKTLSQRDRNAFGLVRLDDENESFAWGKYSQLASLSEDDTEATAALIEIYRQSKGLIKNSLIENFIAAAKKVRSAAIEMGAYSKHEFSPGLDVQALSTNLKNLSLHGENIPIRLAGLGTRRLTALAIQRLSIPDGAIVIADEIESGLEPHRIRHILNVLRKQTTKLGDEPVGQVLITTHSSVAVEELNAEELVITSYSNNELKLLTPEKELQPLIRKNSQALLSKSILVCEGRTEIGLLRSLRNWWSSRNNDEPMEFRGVVFSDGSGSSAPNTALRLAKLGYKVALFRDSDKKLSEMEIQSLLDNKINVYQWDDSLSTEQIIFKEISETAIQRMLNLAIVDKSEGAVKNAICKALEIENINLSTFSDWTIENKSKEEIRKVLGDISKKYQWYKRMDLGDKVGEILSEELKAGLDSSISKTMQNIEAWIYDK